MALTAIKVNKVDSMSSARNQSLHEAIELFHFAFRAFTARPDEILAQRGLARMHHRVLYFVARRPGQRVSDLLATLGVSKQALHGPLRQLVDAGLIQVAPDPEDRRGRCLSLTADGKALESKLSATQRDILSRVFRQQGADAEAGWRQIMAALADEVRPE
jgi:DNA-binding MarR family transcriptional regulator